MLFQHHTLLLHWLWSWVIRHWIQLLHERRKFAHNICAHTHAHKQASSGHIKCRNITDQLTDRVLFRFTIDYSNLTPFIFLLMGHFVDSFGSSLSHLLSYVSFFKSVQLSRGPQTYQPKIPTRKFIIMHL